MEKDREAASARSRFAATGDFSRPVGRSSLGITCRWTVNQELITEPCSSLARAPARRCFIITTTSSVCATAHFARVSRIPNYTSRTSVYVEEEGWSNLFERRWVLPRGSWILRFFFYCGLYIYIKRERERVRERRQVWDWFVNRWLEMARVPCWCKYQRVLSRETIYNEEWRFLGFLSDSRCSVGRRDIGT